MKFGIVYDNGVSLQTIVVYMKFPKEVHQPQLCRCVFLLLLKFCM